MARYTPSSPRILDVELKAETTMSSTEEFRKWISKKCPADEWVYRGQRASYENILPAIARGGNDRFFGNRLHNIEPRVAVDLFAMSPVFEVETLVHSDFLGGIDLDKEHYLAFLPDPGSDKVSLSQFLRCLAQHYGVPTLCVDLTLDPWVALSFATNNSSNGNYEVSTVPGIVYRWPASRISESRMQLAYSSQHDIARTVDLLDISNCSPHFKRPLLQSSVLALPVEIPEFNASVFETPGAGRYHAVSFDDIEVADLLSDSSIESFRFDEADCIALASCAPSLDGLFPNIIDLGYSYLSLIGLVSIIAMPPQPENEFIEDRVPEEYRGRTEAQYDNIINVASAILERECFRLVPEVSLSTQLSRNVKIAVLELHAQAKLALEAIGMLNNAEQIDSYRRLARELSFRMLGEMNSDFSERLRKTLPSDYIVYFNYAEGKIEAGPFGNYPKFTDWIEPEIKSRLAVVDGVTDFASFAPAYAFGGISEHRIFLETLDSNRDYQTQVENAVQAIRNTHQGFLCFPPGPNGGRWS